MSVHLVIVITCWELYQMFDEVGAVAWEHVDDGNLDHRVAGGLEAHRGASDIDQYLTGEGRIVDLHGITGSVLLIIFRSLISLCFITCLIRISFNLKKDQNRPHDPFTDNDIIFYSIQ